MRKKSTKILSSLLCFGVLGGCTQTSDEERTISTGIQARGSSEVRRGAGPIAPPDDVPGANFRHGVDDAGVIATEEVRSESANAWAADEQAHERVLEQAVADAGMQTIGCGPQEPIARTALRDGWRLVRVRLSGPVVDVTKEYEHAGVLGAGAAVTTSSATLAVTDVPSGQPEIRAGDQLVTRWMSQVEDFDKDHRRVAVRDLRFSGSSGSRAALRGEQDFLAAVARSVDGDGWTLRALYEIRAERLAASGLGFRAGTPVSDVFTAVRGGAR